MRYALVAECGDAIDQRHVGLDNLRHGRSHSLAGIVDCFGGDEPIILFYGCVHGANPCASITSIKHDDP
jgi:hypothetical protein